MWRYEVSYRDYGILKNKGFGYKVRFEKFISKLLNNPERFSEIRTLDNTVPQCNPNHSINY